MTQCALCKAEDATPFAVAPKDDEVALCAVCREGAEAGPTDGPHWQCLNEAIWSTVPAEKVLAWRLLKGLNVAWANDVLEMAYLEPEEQEWAEAGMPSGDEIVHRDVNGTVLQNGDTVTLIKALPVKGAGFTAKQGTAVRKISLEPDNAEHISGRVEGQRIVILTKFVKKS
ncbi:alkylphosphonate utilization protein [Tropicibacter naphthalenivorans]|uniref:Putative alkylphosphonate utilization operon protein PhnA n=1 Tax=Tropicibacter naphthalenivorans TaxID=441103 RepID=A0A0N7M045_9RHOB|nr:alkylphosphonate utilization protein [Tropicibacter naphthalenivorans]CUH79441.1 putative alkylphosphonate utilization operon protein PhnA [Tropicibacter naphthalenivorans]SMC72255.1 phosphonoacetate hydrolase [Tropicibacter naphthalenivorans]